MRAREYLGVLKWIYILKIARLMWGAPLITTIGYSHL